MTVLHIICFRLHDADSIEGAIAQATDPENGIIAGLRELRAAGIYLI